MPLGSTRRQDIVVPKGKLIAYKITSGAVATKGLDLGYCQEGSLKITEEVKEKYTSRDHSMTKIISEVVKKDYTMPCKLISINKKNLAMLLRASVGSLIQNAGAYSSSELAVTAPDELDYAIKLGKRDVSITRIDYDGGTAAFTVGATLSTGSSTAYIAWKTGTVATGSLYVVALSGADFINNAVLADDNGTPGAAVQNGAVEVEEDVVLLDSAETTRYVLDTDYGLDIRSGTIFFPESGGSIAASASLKAWFDYGELSETTFEDGDDDHYQIEVLPDKKSGENCLEFIAWECATKFDGELKLLTEGTDEVSIDVTFTPLTNGPNSTAAEPVYRMILDES